MLKSIFLSDRDLAQSPHLEKWARQFTAPVRWATGMLNISSFAALVTLPLYFEKGLSAQFGIALVLAIVAYLALAEAARALYRLRPLAKYREGACRAVLGWAETLPEAQNYVNQVITSNRELRGVDFLILQDLYLEKKADSDLLTIAAAKVKFGYQKEREISLPKKIGVLGGLAVTSGALITGLLVWALLGGDLTSGTNWNDTVLVFLVTSAICVFPLGSKLHSTEQLCLSIPSIKQAERLLSEDEEPAQYLNAQLATGAPLLQKHLATALKTRLSGDAAAYKKLHGVNGAE